MKIIVRDNNKPMVILSAYETQLVPMMGDLIDIPKMGAMTVCKRVFDVTLPDEITIFVKY
jgi:hypothetical protein